MLALEVPNLKCHRPVGQLVGGFAAICCAADQNFLGQSLETVGGVLGGDVGARLPDCIDPPLHSFHRRVGHGVVPVAAAAGTVVACLPEWQRSLRNAAGQCEQCWRAGAGDWAKADGFLGMALFCIAAGTLPGVVAGYASHLIMDLGTPRRLSWVG
jgi:hypothetical protein